jgi:hypothetical protein
MVASPARDRKRFTIDSEELFQGLWIPPGNRTNCVGSLALFLTISEVSPKMAQVIEGVRIETLLYCPSPLLIRDLDIPNLPPDRFAQSRDNFPHGWSCAYQRINVLRGKAGVCQESCSHAGYVFRAGEWNDGLAIAPGQERGILLGHAPAHKRAHVFVVGWRLQMNRADPCPVEDAIGQPMLQIAERGGALETAEGGIIGRALKLRIVHHQFQTRIASRCRKDDGRLKQPGLRPG